MNIISNENINRGEWLELLNKSPFASPFQTSDFFDFYNSLKGFSADVFGIEDNNELKAIIVITIQKEKGFKAYFSRRGIIYGGPLLSEDIDLKLYESLLNHISKHYKNKLIYIEIRNYFNYSKFNEQYKKAKFVYVPWLNFHQKIYDTDKMLKDMSSSRRRQIKKANKSSVVWEEANNELEVSDFYELLKDLYKKKIKKPLFPLEFFIKFFNQKLGKFLLVKYKDNIIGGIMCPILPNRGIYEYYVCGLDAEFKKQYPSIMATWAAMEYASLNNIPLFDFMGAGKSDEAYGVREFKSRFGGEQVEHGRYLKILNPFLYRVGKIGLKVLSKIK